MHRRFELLQEELWGGGAEVNLGSPRLRAKVGGAAGWGFPAGQGKRYLVGRAASDGTLHVASAVHPQDFLSAQRELVTQGAAY